MSFGKRSLLIDHQTMHGITGLTTLIGVRATTARGMASKALDLVLQKSPMAYKGTDSENTPIYGGNLESSETEIERIISNHGAHINKRLATNLVANYGSNWPAVLKYAEENPNLFRAMGNSTTLGAEILHAVREEMAVHLNDVIFRRTDYGTGRVPDSSELEICARLMAGDLGWNEKKIEKEVASVGQQSFQSAIYPN
jgi:glycerol-3-phosphate dehydrogenase